MGKTCINLRFLNMLHFNLPRDFMMIKFNPHCKILFMTSINQIYMYWKIMKTEPSITETFPKVLTPSIIATFPKVFSQG